MKQPLPRRPKGGKDEKESLRGLGGILNDRTREGKVKGAGEAEKSFKRLPGCGRAARNSETRERGVSESLSVVGHFFPSSGGRRESFGRGSPAAARDEVSILRRGGREGGCGTWKADDVGRGVLQRKQWCRGQLANTRVAVGRSRRRRTDQ